MKPTSCLIVGAGMAGLLAARQLQAQGVRVTVLDKGRGVGGRMATRRVRPAVEGEGAALAVFDHGAQFFTVRDERFAALVDDWQEAGVVAQWSRGFATADGSYYADGHPRYRGVGGMTAIAKHLAHGLDVRLATRAVSLQATADGWQAITSDGQRFEGASLILTPPVPQALALLDEGGVALPETVRRSLEAISYEPCLALLVLLPDGGQVPEPGGLWPVGEPLAWVADNHRKQVSPRRGAITLHAGPEFSQAHWDSDKETVAGAMLAAAAEWLGADPLEVQLQRWRYSKPVRLHGAPCLAAVEPAAVVFAGDAFAGPRVEGAALSGLAAADWLLAD
ncbi:MAG: FAD-dependent oxidoreductase [Candidatus Promineifilaceae bacterium]|nr:FAD-dependent oxidoreductase [Candidatus Promineifilaceae bacterium]